MMTFKPFLAAAALAFSTALLPQTAAAETGSVLFEDMQFFPMAEGSPVLMSVLWGDPATGPSGVMLKMPAGFETPIHTHSAGYRAVVIQGQATHWIEGADPSAAHRAGPGSYVVQPAGEWHGDLNAGPGEVVVLVIYDGPIDFVFKE